MSNEDAEIVRRWIWAFEHDADAFAELTHPQMEWAPFENNHTLSHGLDGAKQIRTAWLEAWAEHRLEVEEMLEAGEELVVTIQIVSRGRESGVEVDVRLYGHMRVRDGKVAYLYEHVDRADALRAAGITAAS
jgi:ketosteroid isomerase-like protein